MKRTSVAVVAVAVAAAVPAVAVAGDGGGRHDSVTGGGQNGGIPTNHFEVSAHSDAAGGDLHGRAHFIDTASGPPIRRFAGDVVCMRVSGNRATVVFKFDNTKNVDARFGGDILFLEDGGEGRSAQPDYVQNIRLTTAATDAYAAGGCPAPVHPVTPISAGNINITDAP